MADGRVWNTEYWSEAGVLGERLDNERVLLVKDMTRALIHRFAC